MRVRRPLNVSLWIVPGFWMQSQRKRKVLTRCAAAPFHGPDFSVLYLTGSKLTPRNFYNGLLEQLGCDTHFYRGEARKKLHHQIEIMRGVENRKLVVIVDESHLLDREMLEEIRFP